jgi:iron complex outermembrane recepter protein
VPLALPLSAALAFLAPTPAASTTLTIPPLVVTGTRLRGPEDASFLPIARFEADLRDASAAPTFAEFLQTLPYSVGATYRGSRPSANSGATSSLNFRGLGGTNALVALDGRRLPRFPQPDGASLNYDVANLPDAVLGAVEVLPQGAAAIYGSDAIAGVVNLRLNTGFRGTRLRAGYSQFAATDGARSEIALTHGTSFQGGWLVLAADAARQNDVLFRDRPVSASEDHRPRGRDYRQSGGWPGQVRVASPVPGLPSEWTNGGRWLAPATTVNGVLTRTGPTRTPRLADFVALPSGDLTPEGTLRVGATPNGLDRAQWSTVLPGERTWGLAALGEWSPDARLTVFWQAFHRNRETTHRLHPALANLEDDSLSRKGDGPAGEIVFPRTSPYNPFGIDLRAVQFHLAELGGRRRTFEHRTPWLVVGVRGPLGETWDWELAATAAESRVDERSENQMRDADLQAGLAGRLGGYINPFGPSDPGVIERARTSWTMTQAFRSLGTDARVRGAIARLPAGPVQLCAGAEVRRERYRSDPEAEAARGEFVSWGRLPVARLGRQTLAAYAEAVAPLASTLDLQLASRTERAGPYRHTLRPSLALAWRAQPWLTLRASTQTTFKAPEMLEAGGDVIEIGTSILDPRRPDLASYPIRLRTGANPELRPERGRGVSLGARLGGSRPGGFALDLDAWTLEKTDIITSVGWPFLMENETNQDFPAAARISRQPSGADGRPGPVLLIDDVRINIDRATVSGVDLAFAAPLPTIAGVRTRARLQATRLVEHDYRSATYGTVVLLGRYGFPRWRGLAVIEAERGPQTVAVAGTLIGAQTGAAPLPGAPLWEEDGDLQVHLTLTRRLSPHLSLSVAVTNLLDADPPANPNLQRGYNADLHPNTGRALSLRLSRDWR